MQTHKLA